MASFDKHAVQELIFYADNDRQLYENRKLFVVSNLLRKKSAGKYDPELAVKLWAYYVEDAAKKYAREYATPNEWKTIFTPATRHEVARIIAERENAKIDDGKYDFLQKSSRTKPVKKNPRAKQIKKKVKVLFPYVVQRQAPAGNWSDDSAFTSIERAANFAQYLANKYGEQIRVIQREDYELK